MHVCGVSERADVQHCYRVRDDAHNVIQIPALN